MEPRDLYYDPIKWQREFMECEATQAWACTNGLGAGATTALILAALDSLSTPGKRAIIFSSSPAAVTQPGGILDRLIYHFHGRVVAENEFKLFRFNNGSELHLDSLCGRYDQLRFASEEYQFIGYDNLHEFSEEHYAYMFSRLRNGESLKVRATTTAQAGAASWPYSWYKSRKVPIYRMNVTDNPYIDHELWNQVAAELPQRACDKWWANE